MADAATALSILGGQPDAGGGAAPDPMAEKLSIIAGAATGRVPPARESSTAVAPASSRGGTVRNLSAGLNEGLANTFGAPVDAITWLMNRIPGVDVKEPFGGSDFIKNKVFGSIGINPNDVQAENTADRIARGIGTGMGGMVAPEFAGRAIGSALPAIVRPLLEASPNLPAAGASAAGGAAAGGVGATAAEMVPPDHPEWKPLVATVGGIVPGAAAAGARGVVNAAVENVGRQTLSSPAAQREAASAQFAPEAAKTAQRQTLEDLAGPGAPGDLLTGVNANRAAIDEVSARNVASTTAPAVAAADRAIPQGINSPSPVAVGEATRAATTASHAALSKTEDDAYTALRGLPYAASGDDVRAAFAAERAKLSPMDRVSGEETALYDTILTHKAADAKPGYADAATIPLNDLLTLRTRIGSDIAAVAASKTNTVAKGRLDQLYSAVLGQIEKTVGPKDAAVLAAATNATKAKKAFESVEPTASILASTGRGGIDKTPTASLPSDIMVPGPAGGELAMRFRTAVGDTAALPVLRDAAVSKLLGRGALRADGTLDPKVVEKFRSTGPGGFGEALKAHSELDSALSDAAHASRAVEEAVATRQAALDAYQQDAVGKVAKLTDAAEVPRVIGGMLESPTAPTAIGALAREAALAGPAAEAGLRNAIITHLTTKFVGTAGTLKEPGFVAFVRKPTTEAALREARFTDRQIANIQALARTLEDEARMRPTATAGPLAPAPVSGWKAAIKRLGIDAGSGIVGTGVGTVVGAAVGAPFAGAAIGGTVGAAASEGLQALRTAGIRNTQDLFERMMRDPDLGRAVMTAAKMPSKGAFDGVGKLFIRRSLLPSLVTSENPKIGR